MTVLPKRQTPPSDTRRPVFARDLARTASRTGQQYLGLHPQVTGHLDGPGLVKTVEGAAAMAVAGFFLEHHRTGRRTGPSCSTPQAEDREATHESH